MTVDDVSRDAVADRGDSSREVAGREQAEAALRENEARYRTLATVAPVGIFHTDVQGLVTYVNEKWCEIGGMTPEEAMGTGWLAAVHPEDRVSIAAKWDAFARNQTTYRTEYRYQRPDGVTAYCYVQALPETDADGKLTGYIGCVTDISERKWAEEALRESEAALQERQALLIQAAKFGGLGQWVWEISEGRISYITEQGASIYDTTPEIFSYERFLQDLHPDDRPRVEREWLAAAESGTAYDSEFRFIRSDGETRIIHEVGDFLPDEGGGAGRYVGTIQDITARKRAEEALREAHDELERRVADRTRELLDTNTQLVQEIAERNRVEAALRENSARLTRAQKVARIGNWEWDEREDRQTHSSHEDDRIWGMPHGTLPASLAEFLATVHPDDRERVEAVMEQAFRDRTGYTVDYKIVRPDGDVVFVLEHADVELDESGELVRTLGTVQDITELKRSEEARRVSETRYREIFDDAPGALWVEDWSRVRQMIAQLTEEGVEDWRAYFADHRDRVVEAYDLIEVLQISNANLDLYRATSMQELVDSIQGTRVLPEELDAFVEVLLAFIEGRWSGYIESLDARMDGTEMMVRTGYIIPLAHRHDWSRMIYAIENITDRKQAQEALRESEARYRELFDESPTAIWVEDWSPIKQMLDDLARGGVKDWPGYFNSHRDQLKTAYDLAEVIDISRATVELYRKDSKEHMLQMTAGATVIDEELDAFREMVLAYLAGQTTFDIESKDTAGDGSEIITRRRMVIPPKHHGDWSRVIYAIEDITDRKRAEAQLFQAQKMEAVGQLTGGIAHDFNNLLAVIMGNLELVAEQLVDDDDLSVLLGVAVGATEDAATLTQRLLAFSRNQPLSPRVGDANALVRKMITLMRGMLDENIALEAVLAEGEMPVFVDPVQLESALLNLVVNARDAMPPGGAIAIATDSLRVDEASAEAMPGLAPGDYVVLGVSDTGSGMTPEVLEHAFEPFFTTKQVGDGSGLGLSMVYGFVKQSGGHVTIDSAVGRGTTVKLYLPTAQETAVSEAPAAAAPCHAAAGETILVVEDEVRVRRLAVAILTGLGYTVLEAGDADAALAIIERTPDIELLFTDIVLPGKLNGVELAREARRRRPALAVLYASAYPANVLINQGRLESGADLVEKPYRKDDLAARLAAALAPRSIAERIDA